MKRFIYTIISSAILVGCGLKNQGTSSYYHPDLSSNKINNIDCIDLVSSSTSNGLIKRFISPDDVAKPNQINAGSNLYISLSYAQFVDITETGENYKGAGARAEVAILANVEEYDGTVDHTSGGRNNARVIFYTDSARVSGQSMNFTSVPIYGPIKYNGGIIKFQIYALEQDKIGSSQFSAVLSQLASLGSAVYAPASKQMGLLSSIGGALIKAGAKDDMELYHLLFLHPSEGLSHLPQSTLRAGSFVIIKDGPEKSQESVGDLRIIDYSKSHLSYCLNSADGRLYWKEGSNPVKYNPVLNKTYLTIQINTGYNELANKINAQQTYQELLDYEINKSTASTSDFNTTMTNLISAAHKENNFDEYRSLVRELGYLKEKYDISKIGTEKNKINNKYQIKINMILEKLRSSIVNNSMENDKISESLFILQPYIPKDKWTHLISGTFKSAKDVMSIRNTLAIDSEKPE